MAFSDKMAREEVVWPVQHLMMFILLSVDVAVDLDQRVLLTAGSTLSQYLSAVTTIYCYSTWKLSSWQAIAPAKREYQHSFDKTFFFPTKKYWYFSYLSTEISVMGTHWKCLDEAPLLSTHYPQHVFMEK